jgi:hypothetical protein
MFSNSLFAVTSMSILFSQKDDQSEESAAVGSEDGFNSNHDHGFFVFSFVSKIFFCELSRDENSYTGFIPG